MGIKYAVRSKELFESLSDIAEIGVDTPKSLEKVKEWIVERLKESLPQALYTDTLSKISFENLGKGMVVHYCPKEKSREQNPFVAFADIDALPTHDASGDSEKGWHGCGHNGHATALATAFVTYVINSEMNLNNNVFAEFQSVFYGGEETGENPPLMLDKGLLDKIPKNAKVLFIHNSPRIPKFHEIPLFVLGRNVLFVAKEGAAMAGRDVLQINFEESKIGGFDGLFSAVDFLREVRVQTIVKTSLFSKKPGDSFLPENLVKIQPVVFERSEIISDSNVKRDVSFTITVRDEDITDVEKVLSELQHNLSLSNRVSEDIKVDINSTKNHKTGQTSFTIIFKDLASGHGGLSSAPEKNSIYAMADFVVGLRDNSVIKNLIHHKTLILDKINDTSVENSLTTNYAIGFDMRYYDFNKRTEVVKLVQEVADRIQANYGSVGLSNFKQTKKMVPTINDVSAVRAFQKSTGFVGWLSSKFLKPVSASDTFGAVLEAARTKGRTDISGVYGLMVFKSHGPALHEKGYEFPLQHLMKLSNAIVKAIPEMTKKSS
ncbi:M20/M25/M40 family metallo-hydrolase [Wenyingzhuangia sp. IMCC45574]